MCSPYWKPATGTMTRKPFEWPEFPDAVRFDFDLPAPLHQDVPAAVVLVAATAEPQQQPAQAQAGAAAGTVGASSSRADHCGEATSASANAEASAFMQDLAPSPAQPATSTRTSSSASKPLAGRFVSTAKYYTPDLMDRLLQGEPVALPPVRQQRRQSSLRKSSTSMHSTHNKRKRASSAASSSTSRVKLEPGAAEDGGGASVAAPDDTTTAMTTVKSERAAKSRRTGGSSIGWAYIIEREDDKDYLDCGLYYEPAIQNREEHRARRVRKARIKYTAEDLDYLSIDAETELNWAPRNYGWFLLEEERDFRLPFNIMRDHYGAERKAHPELNSIRIRELTPTPPPTPTPEPVEEEPEEEEEEEEEEEDDDEEEEEEEIEEEPEPEPEPTPEPEDPEVIQARFEASRKPERFRYLYKNVYVNRRPWKADSVMICECEPPEDPEGYGCGTECINRMMQYICDKKTCPCGDRCSNVPLKRRQGIPEGKDGLLVVWTGDRGFGLKTLVDIARGQFIMEYRGEIISRDESYKRVLTTYKDAKSYYFLDYDGYDVIDAGMRGNASRFINHSCGPNVKVVRWKMAGYEEYEIGMYAMQDIPAGTELTYNYGWQDFSDIKSNPNVVALATAAAAAAGAETSLAAPAAATGETTSTTPAATPAAESADESGSDLASSLLGPVASTSSHSSASTSKAVLPNGESIVQPNGESIAAATPSEGVTPAVVTATSAPARQPCFCGAPQCSGILGGKKKSLVSVLLSGSSSSAPNSKSNGKAGDKSRSKGKKDSAAAAIAAEDRASPAGNPALSAAQAYSATYNSFLIEKVIEAPTKGSFELIFSAAELAERERRLQRKQEREQMRLDRELKANARDSENVTSMLLSRVNINHPEPTENGEEVTRQAEDVEMRDVEEADAVPEPISTTPITTPRPESLPPLHPTCPTPPPQRNGANNEMRLLSVAESYFSGQESDWTNPSNFRSRSHSGSTGPSVGGTPPPVQAPSTTSNAGHSPYVTRKGGGSRPGGGGGNRSKHSEKRGRGRPRGTGRLQLAAKKAEREQQKADKLARKAAREEKAAMKAQQQYDQHHTLAASTSSSRLASTGVNAVVHAGPSYAGPSYAGPSYAGPSYAGPMVTPQAQ